MTNNKMTNKKALEIAIAALNADPKNAEVVAKLEKMVEQLEKKSGADRKPTAKQQENDKLRAIIMDWMTPEKVVTVSDMMKEIPELDGMSNQKVSALVKPLFDNGKLTKEIIKGRSYFSRAKA